MPHAERSNRPWKAVLWEKTDDESTAEVVVKQPVEINVRWESRQSQDADPQGRTISLVATVAVDRDIPIDSIMAQGDLEDWGLIGTASVETVGDLYIVKSRRTIPDVKGRNVRRVVGLQRYRDTLPRQV